jgi:hypothetical protein
MAPRYSKKNIDDLKLSGAMAERTISKTNGKTMRRLKLRKEEREEFSNQRMIETAVALFLDIEHDHKWQDIAAELGISVQELKYLTRSDEFMEVYNLHFAELGHDPRLKAAQAEISNLLPTAMRQLRKLLTDERTPPTVLLATVKELFRLAGVEQPKTDAASRTELANFLREAGVNIGTVNVNPIQVPEEYQSYVDGQVIEAPPEIIEVPQET